TPEAVAGVSPLAAHQRRLGRACAGLALARRPGDSSGGWRSPRRGGSRGARLVRRGARTGWHRGSRDGAPCPLAGIALLRSHIARRGVGVVSLDRIAAVAGTECSKLSAQLKTRVALAACAAGPFVFAAAMRVQNSLPEDTLFGRSVKESGFALSLVVL